MLVGRDVERARIGALLEAAHASRSSALTLRGEPGVGKTALLDDARRQAAGMSVLTARGQRSESELPFAGLHQLLRPVLGKLDEIPAPQAAALRRGLGLEDGAAQERFLISAACLSLLSETSEEGPILCTIDDAHWLDAASADALLFVARRLAAEGIVILFATREGEPGAFAAPDIPSIVVTGLDRDASAFLVARSAPTASASVIERLVAHAQGNPLALVELPVALTAAQLSGDKLLPDALPLTQRLEDAFLGRVRQLPANCQRLLLVAAADDTDSLPVVTRAAATLGLAETWLIEAERAGLVSIQGSLLAFRHPLVRSAIYAGSPWLERRAAHLALAEALAGTHEHVDRRAWHLAAGSIDTDENVAQALVNAAERAGGRGAYATAARAFQRAAELSSDPARSEYLAKGAWAACLAGRNDHAAALALQAEPVRDPLLRAHVAQVRGLLARRRGRPQDVVSMLVDVANEVRQSQPAAALELLILAASASWQAGDRPSYVEVAESAQKVVAPPGDERSAFNQDALVGFAALAEGGDTSTGVQLLTQIMERGTRTGEPVLAFRASWAAGWLGDEKRLGELAQRAERLARARGDIGTLAEVLGYRAYSLVLGQRFSDALVAATEAARLARELQAANLELYPRAVIAMVSAVRGDDETAQLHAEKTVRVATTHGVPLFGGSLAVHALGLLDLGRGRWKEALERLDALLQHESRSMDPTVVALLPDAVEAAIRAGQPSRATVALDLLEEFARYAPPAVQPRVACCRALVTTGTAATRHFETAMDLAAMVRPFDGGRMHLLYGEHLRRERRRVDARVHLRAALNSFESLGAEPWAQRARMELRASGETARKRDPSTIEQLTAQELQIAGMVADGLSNKEVAAQLFLSPRTIDHHLRNVFAKLGITSRTQLARLDLDEEPVAASGEIAHA